MASRTQDVSSDDDSFAQFSPDENESDEENTTSKSKSAALADEDSDEAELERLVLGGRASFREALFRDDFTASSNALAPAEGEGTRGGIRDLEDSALFVIDTVRPERPPTTAHKDQEPGTDGAPAWEDSDDERLTVSLAGVAQRRKLRIAEGEDLVSGAEYSRRLRQQYLRLYPAPKWSQESQDKPSKQRRRSSASFSASDSEEDGHEDFGSALPLEKFLRDVKSFNGHESEKRRLRPETINIQRTRDIPDQHKAAITALHFHPQFPILLSSSISSVMYLHHFAPTAHPTPNPMLTSVQAKGTPIRRAQFLHPHGDEIVFAGRRRYFHSWNLGSGEVKKVSQVLGHAKEHKTMERFRPSPCGRYIALIATDRKGGGMLNILSMSSMQWIAQARLESRGGIADFAWWSNGSGLTMLGRDGRVAEWSLSTRRTVGTWRDPGSVGGTVMALGGRNGPIGLGGDSWVALGSTSGILTIYDRSELISRSDGDQLYLKPLPEARRTFEQLTTPVTFVTFTADAQLMAFGSLHKKDALRLVHLPSCAVYSNWPTAQTPLGRITAATFSAQSNVLAVGNDTGKIRLWEIRA